MIRIAAIVGAIGAILYGLSRAPRGGQVAPEATGEGPMPETPAPPPETAAPDLPGPGLVSPAQVVELARIADPEGWMPLADLLAFVQVESSFNSRAVRYEPHLGESSYGLMQVLASSARDRGLQGSPDAMFDPLVGLDIGIRHARWTWEYLASRLGADPSEDQWVGAYNAGVGNVLRNRIPWSYVQKWRAARARFSGA